MKWVQTSIKHFLDNRSGYVWLPISILLVISTIYTAFALTGRPVLDDPGALVGWAYNFTACMFIVFATCLVKRHCFDDIDTNSLIDNVLKQAKECGKVDWSLTSFVLLRTLLDTCETIFLLGFFAYLVMLH